MDLFPATVGVGTSAFCNASFSWGKGKGLVMGYFDGNTVTALWNYAQNFAMNDNSYSTTFGPSTPGLLNLVAGNTFPATPSAASTKVVPNNAGPGTLVGDLDPAGDVCSGTPTVSFGGKNIGDLLNAGGVTWGAFMGGFDLTVTNPNGTTGCNRSTPGSPSNKTSTNPTGATADYIPHHAFFQYWASTANPTHKRPGTLKAIGTSNDGGANHQYDLPRLFRWFARRVQRHRVAREIMIEGDVLLENNHQVLDRRRNNGSAAIAGEARSAITGSNEQK